MCAILSTNYSGRNHQQIVKSDNEYIFLLTNVFLSCSVNMLSKVSQSVNTFLIEVTVHTYITPNAYSVMIVNVLCLRLLLIVHN